ncbi:cytochrome oxidase subunit III [Phaeocystidibacter luteus]|uniref:Cytochrome oxidase subunit III n=2 Tax=Phaeocystidibacter luteus TaxID=911197 RepID=A0A6N6RHR8_9FLAO|nr:cytochrome oxidase subunit III [Phaeocystidibacter luteus]
MEMPQDEKVWGGGNQPMGASYGKLMMWFFLISDALTFSGFLTAYGLMRFKYETTWPIAERVFTHFPGLEGDQPLLYVALMTFILIMSSVTMVLAVHEGKNNRKIRVGLWMLATIVGGLIFLGSQAWEWYHFIIGDKGGIELATTEIVRPADADGNFLTLSELVHGEAGGHGHHEHFTIKQVQDAFAHGDYTLRFPGKDKEYGVMNPDNLIAHDEAVELLASADVVQGANMTRNEYGHKQFANFFFFITGFHGFHVFSGVVLNFIIFYNVMLGTYQRRGHYEMVEKVGLYWHFVDLVWVFVFTFFYLV